MTTDPGPTTPEAARHAVNTLVVEMRKLAQAYWVEHARPPQEIVVLAQPHLYAMLAMRIGLAPDVFGQLDLETGRLVNIGVNVPITVARHVTPDGPPLGYTAVVGNSYSTTIPPRDA